MGEGLRERILGEMTGIGPVEIQCCVYSMDSMRVTLEKTYNIGGSGEGPTIFYNQARLPPVELTHQPNYKIFNLQSVLLARMCSGTSGIELVKMANQ